MYDVGLDIKANLDEMTFEFGAGTFGPIVEKRKLEDIRKSLSNPNATGPEFVYSIAMDVGKEKDYKDLVERNLLYGAMIFAKGQIGDEPIRSQGHIHSISLSCNASTPEVYEIWYGDAIIYMQEYGADHPGRCFAVKATAGEIVIVPPNWVHCTINANVNKEMMFGAWCIRDYGFDYREIRSRGGIAYFPIVKNDEIQWKTNLNYNESTLKICNAREYPDFGLVKGVPIYTQYENLSLIHI